MKELELHFGDAPLGRLRVDAIRGREVFSFAYDADFLKRANCGGRHIIIRADKRIKIDFFRNDDSAPSPTDQITTKYVE